MMKGVTDGTLKIQGKYDVALKLAKHAVNNTPSEFLTWAKLTEGECR
jgi:hypothetical protein